jgi:hypothetical protein
MKSSTSETKVNPWLLIAMVLTFFTFVFLFTHAYAYDRGEPEVDKQSLVRSSFKLANGLPNAQQRVTRVGLLRLCVTNWGFFGSQARRNNET